ncbi:hypothetical protein BBI01_10540 [Chryseobacterium artocarpi]|uniref:Uncharacterized protein n=1 Tax=Chryseobacterium artocarpi TaxID=1414727 RepID=A0A1B8ZLZ4_9FLAO|nr:hypothetical protein BBI01_10540 [Chryseobacterium artocarpi]
MVYILIAQHSCFCHFFGFNEKVNDGTFKQVINEWKNNIVCSVMFISEMSRSFSFKRNLMDIDERK